MRAAVRRLFLASAVVALASSGAPADIAGRLDRPAEELSCTKWWNGKAPKLKKLKHRVLAIHFFDPKKATSKAFFSSIAKLQEKYRERPFTMIEIAVGSSEEWADQYVKDKGIGWLVGHDGEGDASRAYPGSSVPRTYIVGPDGKVAWHAHIGALTDDVVEAQLARVAFFESKTLPRKVRGAAKAAGELRFGAAMAAVEKLRADPYAKDDEKAVADTIEKEIERYFHFQMKLLEADVKALEWGLAWKKCDRMVKTYKGTRFQAEAEKKCGQIQAHPRAVYVYKVEKMLDDILEKADSNKRKDLESMINSLELLVKDYDNTEPARRARGWIKEFNRRLEELDKK